jgi:CMP-N,N'-diacetyllegionaminic acid synthase
MLGDMRVVAVIPARGGSKSVPKKNIRPLAGKPLICWSIDVAKRVPAIDRVIVSTDSEEIAAIARRHGAEIYSRPEHLATDHALVIDALRDLIARLKQEGAQAEIMVLLEPTCPLRSVEDVTKCLELLVQGFDSVATFKEADLNPHRAWKIVDGHPEVFIPGAVPWQPRQELPEAFQLNGAVYGFFCKSLKKELPSLLVGKAGAVLMPRERSVDIDDKFDFSYVEILLKERNLVE